MSEEDRDFLGALTYAEHQMRMSGLVPPSFKIDYDHLVEVDTARKKAETPTESVFDCSCTVCEDPGYCDRETIYADDKPVRTETYHVGWQYFVGEYPPMGLDAPKHGDIWTNSVTKLVCQYEVDEWSGGWVVKPTGWKPTPTKATATWQTTLDKRLAPTPEPVVVLEPLEPLSDEELAALVNDLLESGISYS